MTASFPFFLNSMMLHRPPRFLLHLPIHKIVCMVASYPKVSDSLLVGQRYGH